MFFSHIDVKTRNFAHSLKLRVGLRRQSQKKVRDEQVQKYMFTYDIEGQFYFSLILYLYRPDKCIPLCWTRSNLLTNTFSFNFFYKILLMSNGEISAGCYIGKIICVIRKVIKNYK